MAGQFGIVLNPYSYVFCETSSSDAVFRTHICTILGCLFPPGTNFMPSARCPVKHDETQVTPQVVSGARDELVNPPKAKPQVENI